MGRYVGTYSVGTWCASVCAGLQGSDAGGKRLSVVCEERLPSLAANLRGLRVQWGRNRGCSGYGYRAGTGRRETHSSRKSIMTVLSLRAFGGL